MSCSFRRVLAAAVAAAAVGAVGAAPASASLISTSACDNSTLSQPFAQFGDGASYKLAPGGDFENGASGWTLKGGAAVVAGSEPYAATGVQGKASLSLPAGSSATSPLTCVNAAYPTMRFFAHTGGLSSVVVTLVYKDPLLGLVPLPAGAVALNGEWSPSLPMLTLAAVPGLLTGGTAQVAIRFTALTGTTQVDDVFIDPFRR